MATIPLITQPVTADNVQPTLNALIDQINGFLAGVSPEAVNITGGTIANVTINNASIGATTPSTGNFTALTATSGAINGDTIVTRTAAQTLTNKALTAPVISGGPIDHAVIGGVTPAAATFTTATATTFVGALTGNASTASALTPGATINGVNFTGAGPITITASPPTVGNLTDVGTDGITVTGGTGAVIGTGTSISQHVADSTHNGYLASADWSTFNGKQAAGNYITALTGDATASGPGSVTLTLATVNSNVGSFGSSTAIPTFTVNGKGLITAASTAVVIAPAGTLSGTALNATVVTSSLTSVGTIGTGTWQGSLVAGQYGGTGVANTGKTITLGGNLTLSGAFAATLTLTNTTTLTLPTTGTLATLAGSEALTNKSVNGVTLTAAGSASQFLNGAGSYATPSGLTYSETAVSVLSTSAAVYTAAHGLGTTPKVFGAYIKCTTAQSPFSVGDKVQMSNFDNASNHQTSCEADGTNVIFCNNSSGGVLQICNKSTAAGLNITPGSWTAVCWWIN